MLSSWRAAAFGVDAATATCAAFNLAYFVLRLVQPRGETAARVAAVVALALMSLGALAESLFLLATSPGGTLAAGLPWTWARAPSLAGAGLISLLLLRRLLAAMWPEEEDE